MYPYKITQRFSWKRDISVDGRNPAPVDMETSHVSYGFVYNRWCRISSINSMDEISLRCV